MDWISTLIGALSGGGISAILLFKQNKSSATADAIDKLLANIATQTDAFDKVLNSKDIMIEQLNDVINQKTQVALDNQTKIDKLTREWQERDYEFATMKRQIKTMQNIINDFESRAKHAESNFCSVTECELRVLKLGTYKTKRND